MGAAKKLKVIVIPAWYPSRIDAMPGLPIQNSVYALKDKVELAVLHICADENLLEELSFELNIENDVKIYRVFYKKSTGLFKQLINGFRYGLATIRGYKWVEKHFGTPDLNHVHVLTRTAVWPLYLVFIRNIPFVITEHWSRYLPEKREFSGFLRRMITRLAVKKSSGISAVSIALKQGMESYGLQHINSSVIANSVDLNQFKPVNRIENKRTRFLHVSCFDDRPKNIRGIIRAAIELDRDGYLFDLFLTGTGPDHQVLVNEVNNRSFNNASVIFTGELLGEELVQQYQQADAFILFSNYETQGSVILEANACGVPVIGTLAGGVPEYINAENGFLVQPGNSAQLKQAMVKFINKEVNFNKQSIRELASLFSNEAIGKQYLEFYTKAISK